MTIVADRAHHGAMAPAAIAIAPEAIDQVATGQPATDLAATDQVVTAQAAVAEGLVVAGPIAVQSREARADASRRIAESCRDREASTKIRSQVPR